MLSVKTKIISVLFLIFTVMSLVVADALSDLDRSSDCTGCETDASSFSVIIDAGHGGEDCGAIGINGVYEKDINLSVASELADLLCEQGITVIMTRTEDKLLYTEAQNIKGQKKQFDLKNRLEYARENPEALFVSIHMNKFNIESCRGAQVYFSKNTEESRRLADKIQNSITKNLQDYNTRKIKSTDGGVYLLDNAVGTAVLVECGFLSNFEECEKLSQKDYQSQLSFSIFCGIMEYIKG